jgi:[ribosomal protein S5]-alanine N-acetyltransferase
MPHHPSPAWVASDFPVLETKRLLLREIVPEDAGSFLEYLRDDEVTRYFMEPVTTLEQASGVTADYMRYFRSRAGIVWGLELPGSPGIVGTCGFEVVDWHDRRGDVGFDLARWLWGRGLMREALAAVLEYGFTRMGFNRIQAFTFVENRRSAALLMAAGFTVEGVLREHRLFRGSFRDSLVLSLLRGDASGR